MIAIAGGHFKFVQTVIYANGASGAAETIDWGNGAIQKVSMTDDCTFTFSNPVLGVCRLFINNNDPLGPYTPTWPENVYWENNIAPSFTANRTVLIEFYYDETNYYGNWAEYY